MATKKWQLYIDGKWVDASTGKTFEVTNPATGEVVAEVALAGEADVEKAVQAAHRAKDIYAQMSVYDRAELCAKLAEEVLANKEEIARDLSLEQGKPYLEEALPEVEETALNFKLAAEDIVRVETPIIPSRDPNKRMLTFRKPHGVYAIVTPWNFPAVIPSEYIGPGLGMGNTMVIKPASYTPISVLHIAACAEKAGFPPGVFNVLTGPGDTVGQQLVGHPLTNAVGFTGETVTGRQIIRAAELKPVLLELGGNGPQIVLEDAHIQAAAEAAAFGSFYNAGQVCCATERVLVHEKVKDEFMAALIEIAKAYEPKDPFVNEAKMGPMNNEATAKKMDLHVKDALEKGASLVYGGERLGGKNSQLFYRPTILDQVTVDMLVNQEETFGPIAPIITFKDDDEALRIANGTKYGLQMAVFTSSMKKAFYFADRLEAGNVVINDSTDFWEAHEPFGGGGGKMSGYGRLGGRFTINDMSYLKTYLIDLDKVRG
ncbi:aldehyde dehydrogenase family protein [Anoxynatronum buryatiense]|uniref:3-sulfolactaldehyde dehydrogenase n=1 Tax=Anoxynatronum buryatiense TaxID=489973 RepID=A0AA45WZ19_9CLOT|nr:aldehyde dehydrogenase family protein [Anoxynatronum buryatiense]SMP71678.1 succinate-semialdehyde dehydrogenase / glutarate-semialdehyde dehydrogenase [Anoxynatronum buryatiense]